MPISVPLPANCELSQLRVAAAESLLVGDRPKQVGDAAAVGIITLICRLFRITRRGLDLFLRLIPCA